MTIVIDGMWFGKRFRFMAYYRETGGRGKRAPMAFGDTRCEAAANLFAMYGRF